MKTLLKTSNILLVLLATSCATVNFDNGPEGQKLKTSAKFSNWHHVGILDLVEFSDPVDMTASCQGNAWDSVRIEQGPPQVLVSLFVGSLYSPWDVQYTCRDTASAPKTVEAEAPVSPAVPAQRKRR